jgi:hypothetical protein
MIWRSAYEGGRIIAMSGLVEIGAVFPPVVGGKYRWRLWLRHPSPIEGTAATELGAKTAMLDAWAAFLISADLKEAA